MSTVKELKQYIKNNKPSGCRPYSKLKRNEILKLAKELGYIEPEKKAPAKKSPVKKEPAKKAPVKKEPEKKEVVKKAPAEKEVVKKEVVKKSPEKYAFEPERNIKNYNIKWEGYAPYYWISSSHYEVGLIDIIRKIDREYREYYGYEPTVLVNKNKTYEQNRQIAYDKVYKDYKTIQIEYEKNCRDKFTNKRTKKDCNDMFKHLNPTMFAMAEALEFFKKDPHRIKVLKDMFSNLYKDYKNLPPLPKNIPIYKGKIPSYDGYRYEKLVGHKDKINPMLNKK